MLAFSFTPFAIPGGFAGQVRGVGLHPAGIVLMLIANAIDEFHKNVKDE